MPKNKHTEPEKIKPEATKPEDVEILSEAGDSAAQATQGAAKKVRVAGPVPIAVPFDNYFDVIPNGGKAIASTLVWSRGPTRRPTRRQHQTLQSTGPEAKNNDNYDIY